jgi:prepilin-type N-terminal cleavage/methylation domain-containing protein
MKRAFTLIELLIVVAIIAILAAIAVPNFLEAQTRSKVSRAKADMRSIGMSIQSYHLDNNWIPEPPGNTGAWDYVKYEDYSNGKIGGMARYLTSPISYMTDIPYDTFMSQMFKTQNPHNNAKKVRNASVFMRGASKRGGQKNSISLLFWPRNTADELSAVKGYNYLPTCYWILSSCGPDLLSWPDDRPAANRSKFSGDPNIYTDMTYDPTNGSVSKGDIWMTDAAGIVGGSGK